MEPAIIEVPQPPTVTLSFDLSTFMGQSQLRRSIGRDTILYTGKSVVDRVSDLATSQSLLVTEAQAITAFYLRTNSPVTVTLTSAGATPVVSVIEVKDAILIDQKCTSILIQNLTPDTEAHMKVSYLYGTNIAPP